MKPHHVEGQLLWALVLVVVEVLVEVLQLLLPEQETFCWLPCVAVPLHHVDFDLLDDCVLVLLLFIVGCQHIYTCWVTFSQRNKTMP